MLTKKQRNIILDNPLNIYIMKTKSSYGIGKIYTAVVKKVKKDRIFFDIKCFIFNPEEQEEIVKKAVFFIKQKNFNPFICFKQEDIVDVKVVNLHNPCKNIYHMEYEVIPCTLPADEYIKEHPVGTMVQGTIESITGATMTVCLAPNVYALTKRSKHAHTGQSIDCKIDRFHNQKISLRVF